MVKRLGREYLKLKKLKNAKFKNILQPETTTELFNVRVGTNKQMGFATDRRIYEHRDT